MAIANWVISCFEYWDSGGFSLVNAEPRENGRNHSEILFFCSSQGSEDMVWL
jgi:hypothetical protein